jgi:cytochrome c oxidase subunit IV
VENSRRLQAAGELLMQMQMVGHFFCQGNLRIYDKIFLIIFRARAISLIILKMAWRSRRSPPYPSSSIGTHWDPSFTTKRDSGWRHAHTHMRIWMARWLRTALKYTCLLSSVQVYIQIPLLYSIFSSPCKQYFYFS